MHVLITGANRGIGAALCRHFRTRGDTVSGTSRAGGDLLPLEVTDPVSHQALAERLQGQAIDTLICNAGVYLDKGEALQDGYPVQMWADSFAVNVTGVFLTVQALLPNLKLSKSPRIMIVSSQMASDERAPGGSYIYRSSKAAVLNVGRNLATDLKSEGIAVGIYHPGWVQTDMGGTAAEITVEQAAGGLAERADELSQETTGCFLTWDGQVHAF